jgi:hypothetical protein
MELMGYNLSFGSPANMANCGGSSRGNQGQGGRGKNGGRGNVVDVEPTTAETTLSAKATTTSNRHAATTTIVHFAKSASKLDVLQIAAGIGMMNLMFQNQDMLLQRLHTSTPWTSIGTRTLAHLIT